MSTSSVAAFLFPDANMIPDPILMSDDECDALGDPLANELTDSTVNVRPVALSHYHYEEL